MTEIPGCGKGGWTLVMKVDGDKVNHRRSATHCGRLKTLAHVTRCVCLHDVNREFTIHDASREDVLERLGN